MPLVLRIEPMASVQIVRRDLYWRANWSDRTGSPAAPWRLHHHLKTSESKANEMLTNPSWTATISNLQQPWFQCSHSVFLQCSRRTRLALVSFAHVSSLFGLSYLLPVDSSPVIMTTIVSTWPVKYCNSKHSMSLMALPIDAWPFSHSMSQQPKGQTPNALNANT